MRSPDGLGAGSTLCTTKPRAARPARRARRSARPPPVDTSSRIAPTTRGPRRRTAGSTAALARLAVDLEVAVREHLQHGPPPRQAAGPAACTSMHDRAAEGGLRRTSTREERAAGPSTSRSCGSSWRLERLGHAAQQEHDAGVVHREEAVAPCRGSGRRRSCARRRRATPRARSWSRRSRARRPPRPSRRAAARAATRVRPRALANGARREEDRTGNSVDGGGAGLASSETLAYYSETSAFIESRGESER